PEPVLPREQAEKVAVAMTSGDQADDETVPAGYTYLGQFVDHDLTMDKTEHSLGERVTVDELLQGRSPALDLDSLYGLGPSHPDGARFYAEDGASLKMGRTSAVDDLPEFEGFDLPRRETSPTEPGTALIPDHRNDENLAVAQTHLAFIRFHNRVVRDLSTSGWSSAAVFAEARRQVTLHYQWMLRHDYLPRIVDEEIVKDVFKHGRRFFEVPQRRDRHVSGRVHPGDTPTMPVEFSVAAFRLGHSMVRGGYEWNTVFNNEEPPDPRRLGPATLALLFGFSGTSGFLGATNPLPSNWIADFRRLFDFVKDAGASAEFGVRPEQFNHAKRIDTLLVDPLKDLPLGSFGGSPSTPEIERNLAFRNLLRADMVALATGQEAAKFLRVDGNRRLTAKEILAGNGGAVL
ncbi:peroxidase family protein, partial [Actinomadura adrarensis]